MIRNIEFKFGRAFDKKSDAKAEQKCLDSSRVGQHEMIEENKGENNGKHSSSSKISIPIENKGAQYQADSLTIELPSKSLFSDDKDLKIDQLNPIVSQGSECTFRERKSTITMRKTHHNNEASCSSLLNNDGNLKKLLVNYIPDIIQQLVSEIITSRVIFSI